MYSMVVVAHGCNTPRVDAMTRRLSILRHRLLRAGDRVGSLGFATLWALLVLWESVVLPQASPPRADGAVPSFATETSSSVSFVLVV